MTEFYAVAGDVNATETYPLEGVSDFTSATAEVHVWKSGATATTLAATVSSDGECVVEWGTWLQNLTLTGETKYFMETEVTFGDGTVLTWPQRATDVLKVRPQGA